MIRIICAGYRDEDDREIPCGKIIGEKPSDTEGDSHGYCQDCFDKQMAVLDARDAARAAKGAK